MLYCSSLNSIRQPILDEIIQIGHCLGIMDDSEDDSQLLAGNTLEGDVSDVIALDQLTSPFSPRKATRMSP